MVFAKGEGGGDKWLSKGRHLNFHRKYADNFKIGGLQRNKNNKQFSEGFDNII